MTVLHPHRELARLREFAAQCLAELGDEPPQQPHVYAAWEQARRLAHELRRRVAERISIGFVGAFDAGKSTLLNAVLDMGDLLAAAQTPTTGNITTILLRPVEAPQPPGPRAAVVDLMTVDTVDRCARYLLGKLIAVVDDNRLRTDIDMLRGYAPLTDGWQPLVNVAGSVWADPDSNIKLRSAIWELWCLRSALDAFASWLPREPGAPGHPLSLTDLRAAAALGISRRIPATLPGRVPHIRPRRGGSLSPADLELVFPLIRRVTIEVDAPAGLWCFTGLADTEGVEFIDFPGIGALGGLRDEFLCTEELAGITTILSVIRADRADEDAAAQLLTVLQGHRGGLGAVQDSVLVAINQFDRLTPPPVTGPVRQADLVNSRDALGSSLHMAGELTGRRPYRTAITSGDRRWAGGAPEWSRLADALDAGPGPDDRPGTSAALRAYAHDGGVTYLRELLGCHIGEHGLAIRVRQLGELERELDVLRQWLGRQRQPAAPVTDSARDDLIALFRDMTRLAWQLSGRTLDFIRPAGVAGAAGLHHQTQIRRAAVLLAYRWPHWQQVMRRVDGGYVRAAGGGVGPRIADGRRNIFGKAGGTQPEPNADTSIPLQQRFAEDLADLQATGEVLLRAAVADWTGRAATAVAEVRRRFHTEHLQRLLEAHLPHLDPDDGGRHRITLLRHLVDLDWIDGQLTESIAEADRLAAGGGTGRGHLFPFAERHALPWHPHWAEVPGSNALLRSHQTQLFQLRANAADALADAVCGRLSLALAELYGRLNAGISQLIAAIPTPLHVEQMAAASSAATSRRQ